jgi:hypothetical protein
VIHKALQCTSTTRLGPIAAQHCCTAVRGQANTHTHMQTYHNLAALGSSTRHTGTWHKGPIWHKPDMRGVRCACGALFACAKGRRRPGCCGWSSRCLLDATTGSLSPLEGLGWTLGCIPAAQQVRARLSACMQASHAVWVVGTGQDGKGMAGWVLQCRPLWGTLQWCQGMLQAWAYPSTFSVLDVACCSRMLH